MEMTQKEAIKIAGIQQPFTEFVTSTQTPNSAKSAHRIHFSISNSRNGEGAKLCFCKKQKPVVFNLLGCSPAYGV
jgi:hypothetical protein